jgi:hypothetical protein
MLAGNTVWNPWEPAGAYESIAVATVPSGGVASVTFNSIPQNYAHLQLRVIARSSRSATEDTSWVQFNGDSGNNYATHNLDGYAGLATAVESTNAANTNNFRYITSGANATSGIFAPAIIDVLDYTNTSKFKTTRLLNGLELNDSARYNYVRFTSGLWRNTNPITSITMFLNTGPNFTENSQFALYGIKG